MNDKKKNPLEGIFAQVTDDELLRENGLLYAENKKLQSNWNSLKDWVFEHIDSIEFNSYDDVLDKMNELEGVDNENNRFIK